MLLMGHKGGNSSYNICKIVYSEAFQLVLPGRGCLIPIHHYAYLHHFLGLLEHIHIEENLKQKTHFLGSTVHRKEIDDAKHKL